jgi:hypothetical protein
LRDRLLGELTALADSDQATAWAHRSLEAKNTLTAADAAIVEAEFTSRVAELASGGQEEADLPSSSVASQRDALLTEPAEAASQVALLAALRASVELGIAKGAARSIASSEAEREERVNDAVSWRIDKTALPLGEPRRNRDRDHLKFVSLQPCLVCGHRPSDPHHLRFMQPRAPGRRVSDEFAVLLCRTHHRALHRRGDGPTWWREANLDPVVLAEKLWQTKPRTRWNTRAPRPRTAGRGRWDK